MQSYSYTYHTVQSGIQPVTADSHPCMRWSYDCHNRFSLGQLVVGRTQRAKGQITSRESIACLAVVRMHQKDDGRKRSQRKGKEIGC